MEKLIYTHGRKGQCLTGSDNMTRKGLPVEGQWERVQLYAERYSKRQDIYTGNPLIDEDLEDWYTSQAKSKLGKHLSDYQKEKHKVSSNHG